MSDNKTPSFKEEAENEFMEGIMEDLLPKVKIFAPKIIKSLEASEEFVGENEIVLMYKSKGKIVILKGLSENVDLEAKPNSLTQYDLNFLVDALFKKIG